MTTGLEIGDLPADPIQAFRTWIGEVTDAGLDEPNAMVVSTATPAAAPSSRMTLLKTVDARGFVFFTNYTSRKAAELDANPACSLLFPWHGLRRQVTVEGRAERVPVAESEAYFTKRPYGSRIGAWASHQSRVVGSRAELDERYTELERRWPREEDIPMPDFWGGYLVVPHTVRFWQGRPSRLHDLLRYTRTGDGAWTIERLAP